MPFIYLFTFFVEQLINPLAYIRLPVQLHLDGKSLPDAAKPACLFPGVSEVVGNGGAQKMTPLFGGLEIFFSYISPPSFSPSSIFFLRLYQM